LGFISSKYAIVMVFNINVLNESYMKISARNLNEWITLSLYQGKENFQVCKGEHNVSFL